MMHAALRGPAPHRSFRRQCFEMPTILRDGPYRYFFCSGDGHEPPHGESDIVPAVAGGAYLSYHANSGYGRARPREQAARTGHSVTKPLRWKAWNAGGDACRPGLAVRTAAAGHRRLRLRLAPNLVGGGLGGHALGLSGRALQGHGRRGGPCVAQPFEESADPVAGQCSQTGQPEALPTVEPPSL